MPFKATKRRKFHDLEPEDFQQIKYDAAIAYEMGYYQNPYPTGSDGWLAWEEGSDWQRRYNNLMDEF